jgi:NodT family efflux transporter outer membrane factor (OMF) lipoprotein
VLGCLLLGGCASLEQWHDNGGEVGPNYRPPRAAVADRWIDAGDRSLRGRCGPPARWWAVFDDPMLNRLVAAAARQNLSLRVAGLRILEARAQLGVANGELFPQQQAAIGQYNWNRYSDSAYPFDIFPIKRQFDDWQVGFNAAWELDFWGRFRRGIEAADASLDAQIDGYDDVLVLLQAEVAANYIQMRSLRKRIELARQNAELQQKTLRLVELRYDKGLVTDLDVQRAKANLAATRALIPLLEIGSRKAQNRLCILMAMPPRDLRPLLGASATIPQAPAEVVVGIPADLLRRRPDVRRAEREAAVQSARIGMAEAEFYPHIAITGTIGFEAEDFFRVFQGGSLAAVMGPGFRWNILNYGRIRNAVRAQDARFRQAVATYQETVLRANEEAENAVTSYLRDRDRAASLDAAATATAKAAAVAVLQYEKGLVDYEPVLDTQRELVRQQDAVAESRGQVAVDLVALYKALAGGWRVRMAAPAPPRPVPAATIALLEDEL